MFPLLLIGCLCSSTMVLLHLPLYSEGVQQDSLFLLGHKKRKTLSPHFGVLALHSSRMSLFVGNFLLLWLLTQLELLFLASVMEAFIGKRIYSSSHTSPAAHPLGGVAPQGLPGDSPGLHSRQELSGHWDCSAQVSHNVASTPCNLCGSSSCHWPLAYLPLLTIHDHG